MIRIFADKIASSTKNLRLRKELRVSRAVIAKEGYALACKVLNNKSTYNTLEDPLGRMVRLHEGDIMVGVLGSRNALHGYSGVVPESLAAGDVVQILNLGGVLGKCTSVNPEVGKPFDVEVLGSVLVFPEFESREGVQAHIKMNALPDTGALASLPRIPVVFVAGTCMNSGKTLASCHLVRSLERRGLAVGACKLTGVALLRDVLEMTDYGAVQGVSFIDAGIPSTTPATAVSTARALIESLITKGVQVIVAELGDGIMGEYGVQHILRDQVVMSFSRALVLCASDPVGAWGGVEILRERFKLTPQVISGPVTDNAVGTTFIETQLGVRAINARLHSEALGELIFQTIKPHLIQVAE